MIRYLDTSAALNLIVDESESACVAEYLEKSLRSGDQLVASWLLFTELHCAASRRQVFAAETVDAVVDAVTLIDVEREDLIRAATSSWGLRSANAVHLATAIRAEAEEMISYDSELMEVAFRVGIAASSPHSGDGRATRLLVRCLYSGRSV